MRLSASIKSKYEHFAFETARYCFQRVSSRNTRIVLSHRDCGMPLLIPDTAAPRNSLGTDCNMITLNTMSATVLGSLARCSVQRRESLPASLLNENTRSRAATLSASGSCIGLADRVSPDNVGMTSPGFSEVEAMAAPSEARKTQRRISVRLFMGEPAIRHPVPYKAK